MTPKERYRNLFDGKQLDRVPFVDWVDHGIESKVMELLGEGKDYDRLTAAKRFHMDALYTWGYFAPIFAEKVLTVNNTGLDDSGNLEEKLGDGLIKTLADLDKMKFPDPNDPDYYTEWRTYIDQYGKSDLPICLYTHNIGPYETIFSLGIATFAKAQFRNKKLLISVMDKYVEWNSIVFTKLQEYAGDALSFMLLGTDLAINDGALLLPDIMDEIFVPRSKEIAKCIKVPFCIHSDGYLENRIFNSIIATGARGINPIDPNCMDIFKVREEHKDVILWGNLDVRTLAYGTEEETRQQTRALVELGKRGNFIFASGNSIPDYCNPNNVIAMIDEYEKCADI